MAIQRLSPNGQDDMRLVIERKEEEQSGGVADALDRETWRPVAPGPRRHQGVRGSARKVCLQRSFEMIPYLVER